MALAAFAAIDTVLGTVRAPVEIKATVVAAAAGLLNVTVQTATPAGARVAGLQLIPLRLVVKVLLTLPPLELMGKAAPSTATPTPPETPMLVELADPANVTETVATTPSAMRLVFMPVARQLYTAAAGAQVNVLPAELNAGPVTTLKLATAAEG